MLVLNQYLLQSDTFTLEGNNAISMLREEYLKSEVGNRIDFANDILKNQKINKDEPKVHYNLMKSNKMRE